MKLRKNQSKQEDSDPSKNINDENTKEDQPTIIYRPRITYEDEVILSRKTWIVPVNCFPARDNEENDNEYFLRVNLWRMENNIPSEVYVKITPLPVPQKTEEQNKNMEPNQIPAAEKENQPEQNKVIEGEEKKEETAAKQETDNKEKNENKKQNQRMSRDYYKPQYIDFSSPLFCNLFGKMTINLKNFTMNIEERLPGEEQLLKYGNKSYATEFIFQIDFFNGSLKEQNIIQEEKLMGVK